MKLKIKIRKFKSGSYEIKMNKLIETVEESEYLLKKLRDKKK
jgi:hypothetical protein